MDIYVRTSVIFFIFCGSMIFVFEMKHEWCFSRSFVHRLVEDGYLTLRVNESIRV